MRSMKAESSRYEFSFAKKSYSKFTLQSSEDLRMSQSGRLGQTGWCISTVGCPPFQSVRLATISRALKGIQLIQEFIIPSASPTFGDS